MLDFPPNPTAGQEVTVNGRSWKWKPPTVAGEKGLWQIIPVTQTDADFAAAKALEANTARDQAVQARQDLEEARDEAQGYALQAGTLGGLTTDADLTPNPVWSVVRRLVNNVAGAVDPLVGVVQALLNRSENLRNAAGQSLTNYAALRAYTGDATVVRITGTLGSPAPAGMPRLLQRDDSDTTSLDNGGTGIDGGTVIVDGAGRRWKAVVARSVRASDWGVVGRGLADETAPLVAALTFAVNNYTQGIEPVVVDAGRFKVASLYLGDPAKKNTYAANKQCEGNIYALHGGGRLQTTFLPSAETPPPGAPAGAAGYVVACNNAAGVELRDFGVDGLGMADYGLDLTWDLLGAGAPSCQNIAQNINVVNCRKVGIKADNFYDSTADSWRSNGSPVSVCMRGGGGSMRGTNWNMGGAVKISAQDFTLNNCELLGGLIIDGNTRNNIAMFGGQVFPLGTGGAGVGASYSDDGWINPNSIGWAIDAQNSGTYGCSLHFVNVDFFGGKAIGGAAANTGILKGKLGTGAEFTNCRFEWNPTSAWGDVTQPDSSTSYTKPVVKFVNCVFANANSPYDNVPTSYHVVMENCILHDARRVDMDTRAVVAAYAPVVGGVGDSTKNYGLTSASMRATRAHDLVTVLFDFTISTDPGVVGVPIIRNLPWFAGQFGAVSWGLVGGVPLSGGYTFLTLTPVQDQTWAAFFKGGPGKAITACDPSDIPVGARLAGCFTYRTGDPL